MSHHSSSIKRAWRSEIDYRQGQGYFVCRRVQTGNGAQWAQGTVSLWLKRTEADHSPSPSAKDKNARGVFVAVFFKNTHFNPVFLLVLWFSPPVSPCPGLTNTNWVLPSVPYIYRSSAGKLCLPPACSLLCWTILRPWRWRRYVPSKRRVPLNALHGVVSQKKILFKTTAVKTSNPTAFLHFHTHFFLPISVPQSSLIV
jgi:hypothetical protein